MTLFMSATFSEKEFCKLWTHLRIKFELSDTFYSTLNESSVERT